MATNSKEPAKDHMSLYRGNSETYNEGKESANNGGVDMHGDEKYVTQEKFYEMRLANEVAHARQEEKANSMDWKLNWILGLLTSTILAGLFGWIMKMVFSFL